MDAAARAGRKRHPAVMAVDLVRGGLAVVLHGLREYRIPAGVGACAGRLSYMQRMTRERGYRALCGVLGGLLIVTGFALFGGFFRYHAPGSDSPIPTGPVGHYMMGFAGAALVAWGGCLIGVVRRPRWGRSVGTASAVGLFMAGLMRIVAWVVGDYHVMAGEALRIEAVLFLSAALALIWLRPVLPDDIIEPDDFGEAPAP